MNREQLKKINSVVLIAYVIIAVLFWWIAGDQMRFQEVHTASITPAAPVGELVAGMEIRQPFTAQSDELRSVSMQLSTYARTNTATVVMQVVDADGTVQGETELNAAEIADNTVREIPFAEPIALTSGERYELVLTSPDGQPGNAITVWMGNTVSAAKTEVTLQIPESDKLSVNDECMDAQLHYSLNGRNYSWFGQVYWYAAVGIAGFLLAYGMYLVRLLDSGKNNVVLRLLAARQKYDYLIRQLISRDFKTKYKRSVLGVLWSFLNPLLTMLVQYVVFSTLFKSDIPNFPLYLLSGIVCFNFFSEATTMSLMSIVGNASLITKVYVPKYIYPVTRVLSSTINLLLSLIPLAAVMLFTGTPLRPAVLLLPFGLICLVALSIGIGFILSSSMVFFRDTQFLWGVLSMLWMYATPIFYPESIIGEQYMVLFKCNPLYHIIRFIRIILIDGVSPEPKAYVLCLIASFVPLLIGAVIFKKNQDKFILNL